MRHYKIVNEGMGGMLVPPNDPEHRYSVRSYFKDGSVSGYISLSYALQKEETPEDIKTQIQTLFTENPPEFSEEWERTCYNYFQDRYNSDGEHPAVLHIQKYFPEYELNDHLIHHNGNASQQ